MKTLILLIGAILAVSACGESKKMVGREFRTMAECLQFVKDQVGPLKVITDKPGDVSGQQLGSKRFFRCETKVTGSRGILVEGRWEVPAK